MHLLKPIVERARAMITTDSAPRHYANAFEVPVVVLMGPTDPRYTSANLEETALLRGAVDCGPCQRPRCVLDHACMRGIAPGDVITALDDLLDPVLG
ncbi:MAG: hypothetical protein H6834_16210 [Planctomycetes bacterium]|nr:hypothetical protein [Planctomycetota bacterium]